MTTRPYLTQLDLLSDDQLQGALRGFGPLAN